MARGSPDWYRGFDAFGGGVRLSVRPAYGGCQQDHLNANCDPNDITSIQKIEGQGIIHGGYIYIATNRTLKDDYIYLYIDDVLFGRMLIGDMNTLNHDAPHSDVIYLTAYDDVAFKYAIAFSPGYTFDESFEVLYHNNNPALTVTTAGYIYYALAP